LQLFELEKILADTAADDWQVISDGPTFLYSYMVSSGRGEGPHISAVEEHHSIAVLRTDIDIRIAWGYDPEFGEKKEYVYFKERSFADPLVRVTFGDVFYRAALVQRNHLVSVDSARALLPVPSARAKEGASVTSSDADDFEWFVTQREVNFARLVHGLANRYHDFGSYLQRSGFVVDPV
jgi:hypothetical protein